MVYFWNYMVKNNYVIPELHDCKSMSFRKFKASGKDWHMHFRIYMPCGSGTTYVIPESHVSGISCDRSPICHKCGVLSYLLLHLGILLLLYIEQKYRCPQPHTTAQCGLLLPRFQLGCDAFTYPNKGDKYCTMCAAARTKHQAVNAVPAPIVAAASAHAPAPSKHPSGIILEVVGTAGTDRRHSCKEHASCGCEVLQDKVDVRLQREQILVPDNITGEGKMKEEVAITVNWVLDGVDCCCIGFLPHAYAMKGRL
jgi:hypothetical protein